MSKYGLPKTIVEVENHVGHWAIGTGASSLVDEVRECRKIASRVHAILTAAKVPSTYFQDNTSKNKSQNLATLKAHHNADVNGLVVSWHLNSSGAVRNEGIGVEVLYANSKWALLAKDLSASIAKAAGFKDRGAKVRTDLAVLAGTKEPAILVEVFFVNSKTDVQLYEANFEKICSAAASVLAQAVGKSIDPPKEPAKPTPAPKPEVKPVNKPYRLVSGHYPSKKAATEALDKVIALGVASAKWASVINRNGRWHWRTGAYDSEKAAIEVKGKIIKAQIAWVIDVVEA